MNTINNPLILKPDSIGLYGTKKAGDQSGEYVDKQLAQEMLFIIEELSRSIRILAPDAGVLKDAEEIIIKAKG